MALATFLHMLYTVLKEQTPNRIPGKFLTRVGVPSAATAWNLYEEAFRALEDDFGRLVCLRACSCVCMCACMCACRRADERGK